MIGSHLLKNLWWSMLTRGISLILFGLILLIWPGATLAIAVLILAAYLVIDGSARMIAGIFSVSTKSWSWIWIILLGLTEIILGIVAFKFPDLVVIRFIMLIGLFLIINGFHQIISPDENYVSEAKNLSILAGIFSIIAGFLLLFRPIAGGTAFFWVLGLYALITGPIIIAISFHLKNEIDKRIASGK